MLIPMVVALLQAQPARSDSTNTTYATPALRDLVARVAESNRRAPASLGGYDALVESEVSLLVNGTSGTAGAVAGTASASTEAMAQVEQFQLKSSWDRSGVYTQRVIGYRGRQLGPMFSALSMFRRPWTAPTLYGDRLTVIFSGAPALRTADTLARPLSAAHPFAADRETYYRYTGGDTVSEMRTSAGRVVIALIRVEPLEEAPRTVVFSGDVFVDVISGDIVRMRGRVHMAGELRQSVSSSLVRTLGRIQQLAYIDFENSEHNGRFWLPYRQRLEYQVSSGFVDTRAVIRAVSEWRDLTPREAPPGTDADLAPRTISQLTVAPDDSLSETSGWRHDLGTLAGEMSAHDFDDVAPRGQRPGGAPRFRWVARRFSDLVRFDRVEGLYTGVAGRLELGDVAPGYSVRTHAGWAWYEGAPKWDVEAIRVSDKWVTSLRVTRDLASTNDLDDNIGGAAASLIGGLFGIDTHDWVDRQLAVAGITRELGDGHLSSVRVTFGAGHDAGFDKELTRGVLSGTFTPNRPVAAGWYRRARVDIEVNRSVMASPLTSGLGWALSYENGAGGISWQRAEARIGAQRTLGPFVFALRGTGGGVKSPQMPPQQLFEMGGTEDGLPGYAYKAFAGDAAALGDAVVQYKTGLLDSPIRFGNVTLPSISPLLQVGVFGGRTWASSAVQPTMSQLGWVDSDGWRSTLDIRLRFFAGVFGVGVAHVLDHGGGWRGVIGLGSGY